MPRAKPRVISVGGGKGGVGKSLVAANLAVAMARLGLRVTLVDADLGAANLHTLFGIHSVGPGLQSLLDHEIESLEQAAIATCIRGLHLVRGSSATVGAANLNHGQKTRLSRHILGLDADVVMIDVGAGTSFNTLDLFDLADVKLAVVTPQLTSMQNAYGFLKGAVLRDLRSVAAGDAVAVAALDAVGRGETARLGELISKLAATNSIWASAMTQRLWTFGARIIGNQVHRPTEARAFSALERLMRDFLGLETPVLGHLPTHETIHNSVSEGVPFTQHEGVDEPTRIIYEIAERLVFEQVESAGPVERAPIAEPAHHARGPNATSAVMAA
jgi:flagellar biosynthesis protein FlhG